MKIAYADPPYLGCCALYGHEHGHSGRCWDDLATHERLIDGLCDAYPDGWALSLSAPSLRQLLPLCPVDVRVSPWVKPFAVFKPNVNPAYAWEPVIWRGGRAKRGREEPTVRDWFSGNITLKRGLTGAKPEQFCFWLFDLLGLRADDEFVDIYHGSGAVARAWQRYGERLQFSGCSPNEPEQITTWEQTKAVDL
jgi:hypothetical protein